jgi:glucose/arabinose dehydrogenase
MSGKMRIRNASVALVALGVVVMGVSVVSTPRHVSAALAQASSQGCQNDDSGLKLPPGFCASVFADGIGHARNMVVAPNETVYVNTWSGRYYANDTPHAGGFLVALQDTKGAGKADVIERFGATAQDGGHGGTGTALYKGNLYAELNDRIVRYDLAGGAVVPAGALQTIVSGLPLGSDHPMHPFLITTDGTMYVDVASATNACQEKNRQPKSSGLNPCIELETRGGIWRYDANKTGQSFSPAERYATGIRNAEGFALGENGQIFVTMHGRDQLHANWPEFYQPEQEAALPAEELLLLKKNGDYGWPECYYDSFVQKLVLAPEYGGNGKKIGVCATKIAPVADFPAHWAPNAMVRYTGQQFPERYRHGIFVAFHGSWDRAPYASLWGIGLAMRSSGSSGMFFCVSLFFFSSALYCSLHAARRSSAFSTSRSNSPLAHSYCRHHSASIPASGRVTIEMTGLFIKPGGAIIAPQRFGTTCLNVFIAFRLNPYSPVGCTS